MTTAGLAVACLRAGDEASGLEFLESAVKLGAAATAALAAAVGNRAHNGVLHEQGGHGDDDDDDEEEEEEEEDWELLEAEEEQEEILEAEGEVLPELLGYYLDRVEKERSQEAAAGASLRGSGLELFVGLPCGAVDSIRAGGIGICL